MSDSDNKELKGGIISPLNILGYFFPDTISKLIRNYVAPRQNKSLKYNDMRDCFLIDGTIESDSPKNRRKLFEYLQKNKIRYVSEIIGYTKGSRLLSRSPRCQGERWARKWDVGILIRWINQKRILIEDVKSKCKEMNELYNFEDIQDIFDTTISCKRRCAILEEKWGERLYSGLYTPLSRLPLRKTILCIKLVSSENQKLEHSQEAISMTLSL